MSMTLGIRVAGEDDAEAIAAIYAPAVADRATSFELTPPDAQEMRRRIAAVLQRYPWLVCESSQTVLGYVYATAHRERAAYRWSVDVAAYVSQDAQRRGIARALYTGLFEILSLQGYRNAYAGITLPNPASVEMHEAMGFERVGVYHQVGYKFGKWHDVAWFERPLADHVFEPREPVVFPTVATNRETTAAMARAEGLLRSTGQAGERR
jgi:phosphinothricin acetyltransferase